MARWKNDGRCGGRKDPTAPHDLTEPEALTPDGKCRRCKLFSNRRQKKRTRWTAGTGADEAARTADPAEPERAVTVWPRAGSPESLAYRTFREQGEADERRTVFGLLFDPAEWPDEDSPELPAMPEDWQDVPGGAKGSEEQEQLVQHRVALARISLDRGYTQYTRRLAWLALTGPRQDEKGE